MRRFLLFLILFLTPLTLLPQDSLLFHGSRHKLGIITGYGNQSGIDVEYRYQVVFLQGQYYYSIWRAETWGVDIITQVQYNTTNLADKPHFPVFSSGYEVGMDAGFLVRKNILNDYLSIYAFISSGPHYINCISERQSDGFNFSDNFFFGANVKINKNLYFDTRFGVRHISNAGIQEPNRGFNTAVISGGFMFIP